ncbi:MAG: PQQ-binding-like beta-propeller repeat protein [Candidatus Hydrogenedentes bacterium]|nr:PQQ-binding-like beta-propeller repeat protein [Candidatus Hydrogenedentota bacterium]
MLKSKAKKPEFVADRAARRIAVGVAAVSGLFSLVVCVLLIANYVQVRAADPLDNPELLRLRERLSASPEADEALVEEIRALDLLSRKAFFTSQAHLRMGGRLLLIGAAVFLIAFRLAARWNPRLPARQAGTDAPAQRRAIARTRELVSGIAVILVLAALTAAYMTPTGIPAPGEAAPPDTPGPDAVAESVMPYPSWEDMLAQWPSFRGPGGFGVAPCATAPTAWDGDTGAGIRWKAEVPLPGFNSPVAWDDRVYVSGATDTIREVFCFDADTGELRWRQALPAFPGTPGTPPDVTEDTGYAAPTMAVHGPWAFALFGTGDLACFDVDGALVWGRNIGVPDNHYGHSSSLIALDGELFVQFDDKKQPRLLALDVATGNEVWVAQRSRISWASPALMPTESGFQLILASELDVDAYRPDTGALLWTEEGLDGEVAPSPTFSGSTVFVANEYAMATAIRLDTVDGAVQSEIAWQWEDSLPEVASPTSSADYFYIATSMGEIVCLDVASGEPEWAQEFEQGFYSSPIRVGDRIYAADLKGTTHIFTTGAAFESIAEPRLGEPVYATPGYFANRIYLRTEQHLMCIEGNGE